MMNSTGLNLAMMTLSIGIVVLVSRKKKLSLKRDLGIVIPNWRVVLLWVSLFIFLIAIEDYLFSQFSDSAVESWKEKYTPLEMLLRGIGIVVLAPIAEELMFRGLLFWRIKNSPLSTYGAILIPAFLFTAIHIQYSELLTLAVIFIDGLFYGLARHFSKSVVLAIVLHSLSNLGAVLERIL
ncbi:MAG: CPBP family intramembrane glutamic endopeptidase [Cyclobacteriaceae bacterium]|uniref:CPBP family intramembrane glutamic endopeptidase n=1 Tax=Fulvivirga sp. TaxID=1931237 RepID=UPI0032EE3A32